MKSYTGLFRVFVSSTFSDMVAERTLLQAIVFPRLVAYCRERGARFQAVDLRWGVGEEAARAQRTLDVCLQEVERCKSLSPRLNFILLLGNRYGWRPVPSQVGAAVFEALRTVLPQPDVLLLETWYRRDDNAVPPNYVLQPRTGRHVDDSVWSVVSGELRSAFLRAAELKRWDDDDPRRISFETSATHQEALRAIQSADRLNRGAFYYQRTFANDSLAGAELQRYTDVGPDGHVDTAAARQLARLQAQLTAAMPEENVGRYHVNFEDLPTLTDLAELESRIKNGDWEKSLPPALVVYLKEFVGRVERDLRHAVDDELAALEELSDEESVQRAHREFAEERTRHFVGRSEILDETRKYLNDATRRTPLVVHGPPGSGKTALLGQVVRESANDSGALVLRCLGAGQSSTSARALLSDLCRTLGSQYGNDDLVPDDFVGLTAEFKRRLAFATPERPLLLVLDALDHIDPLTALQPVPWLPCELPTGVKMIVSLLEGEGMDGVHLSALRRVLPPDALLRLGALRSDEAATLLDAWLSEVGRALQPEQHDTVIRAVEACPLPLYVKLAFEEVRNLKSDAGAHALGKDIEAILDDFFGQLERDELHGRILVSRSLSLINAGRNGVSEEELLAVLAADAEVMSDFRHRSPHSPRTEKLPDIVWSRLYYDLAPYLSQRLADNSVLITFYHRLVRRRAAERYAELGKAERPHVALASYFAAQDDRFAVTPNVRKLTELPYQQARGKLWDALERTLTDLSFLEAGSEAGRVPDLVTDMDAAVGILPSERPKRQILRLLEEALRRDLTFIVRHPSTLFQCLWNSCWWYDCSEAATHYETPALGPPTAYAPWERTGEKLSSLLERWRSAKEEASGFLWLRSLRPPVVPLGAPQAAVFWEGGREEEQALIALPDDEHLVSVYSDTLRVRHLPDGTEVLRHSFSEIGPAEALRYHPCAISSDARWLAAVSEKGGLRIWDILNNAECSWSTCLKSVRQLAFSSDGELVAMADAAGVIEVYKIPEGTRLLRLDDCEEERFCTALSVTAGRLAACRADGSVQMYDTATGEELCSFTTKCTVRGPIKLSPHGEYLVALLRDEAALAIWDAASGTELLHIPAPDLNFTCFAISLDGQHLATGGSDRVVRIWAVESGREVAFLRGHEGFISEVAFSSSGRLLASAGAGSHGDSSIRLWDMSTAADISLKPRAYADRYLDRVWGVAFSPDSRLLAYTHEDGTVRLVDADTGIDLGSLQGHSMAVLTVAFSPDGRFILSGSIDSTVRVWDAETFRHIGAVGNAGALVHSVAWSSDARRFASGTSDGTVRVWEVDGTQRGVFRGHDVDINAVAFADEHRLISGASDGKLIVWDLLTGEMLQDYRLRGFAVRKLAVCPDRAELVVVAADRSEPYEAAPGYEWDTTVICDLPNATAAVLEEKHEIEAVAAGYLARPLRATTRQGETAIESFPEGIAIAWFPAAEDRITSAPSGRTWASSAYLKNRLNLFTLEGNPAAVKGHARRGAGGGHELYPTVPAEMGALWELSARYYLTAHSAVEHKDFGTAEAEYRRSLAIKAVIGDLEGIVVNYHELAITFYEQGALPEATRWSMKALRLSERYGDEYKAANVRHLFGRICEARGSLDRAKKWYGKALAAYSRLGIDSEAAIAIQSLGTLSEKKGDLMAAEGWYDRNRPLHEKSGRQLTSAFNYARLGIRASERGDLPFAERQFRTALELFRTLERVRDVALMYNQLGILAHQQTRFHESAEFLVHSAKGFLEANEPETAAAVAGNYRILLRDASRSERETFVCLWNAAGLPPLGGAP